MENGRSLVLGSSLSESEDSELMEGAAAAVGMQQSLGTIVVTSLTSCCSVTILFLLRCRGVSAAK